MDKEQLKSLMERGESESLAFASQHLDAHGLARIISAFANLNGGQIILGLDSQQKIAGVDVEKTKQLLEQSKQALSSPIDIEVNVVRIARKEVLVYTVNPAAQVVTANGCYFKRAGDEVRAYNANEVVETVDQNAQGEAILKLSDSVTAQTALIEKLTSNLEALSTDFRRVNSPKRKLAIGAIGAVAGASLRFIVTLLIK